MERTLVELDLADAVKESANVIGGAVKPLLNGVTTLGIPELNGELVEDTVAVVPYYNGALTIGFRLVALGDGA